MATEPNGIDDPIELGRRVAAIEMPAAVRLAIVRLMVHVDEQKLAAYLKRWADRLDELEASDGTAELGTVHQVHRGKHRGIRFNPDYRVE